MSTKYLQRWQTYFPALRHMDCSRCSVKLADNFRLESLTYYVIMHATQNTHNRVVLFLTDTGGQHGF